MRPKIVILILAVAIGLVALAALFKGGVARRTPELVQTPAAAPATSPPVAATVPPVKEIATSAGSSNSAAVVEQLRAAEAAKELDQIRELQAEGEASPTTTAVLLTKVTHQDPEVRKAALQAIVQLGDTNAIPGLQDAVAVVQSPREKVALMDAIDYLKLPEVTSAVRPPGVAAPAPSVASGKSAGPTSDQTSGAGRANPLQGGAVAPGTAAPATKPPPP
jgi:hypothetical protein